MSYTPSWHGDKLGAHCLDWGEVAVDLFHHEVLTLAMEVEVSDYVYTEDEQIFRYIDVSVEIFTEQAFLVW